MLVPSMDYNEVEIEANYEYDVLCKSSTLGRLALEYFAERIKKKIKPTEKYYKYYEIKTKKKNKWLILLCPKTEDTKVKEPEDVTTMCLLYYYADNGLRFLATSPSKVLSIYNQHFFERYNQRLNLGIQDMKDVAKAYFELNSNITFQNLELNDNQREILGIVSNGFAMGHVIIDKENNKFIILFRTFISRETANMKHAKALFELEKLYNSADVDEDSKLFYESLGYDVNSKDNSIFFKQWEDLRNKVFEGDFKQTYYQVVSDEELAKSKKSN